MSAFADFFNDDFGAAFGVGLLADLVVDLPAVLVSDFGTGRDAVAFLAVVSDVF